jgi:hypothetical protein
MEEHTEQCHTQKEIQQVEKCQQIQTIQQQTRRKKAKRIINKGNPFFHGFEDVKTELLVSLINTEEFNYNYTNQGSYYKRKSFGQIIPLNKILEHSLRFDNIDKDNTKAVEKYATIAVNRFFRELTELMFKYNCVFHSPFRKIFYMFITLKTLFVKNDKLSAQYINMDNIFIVDNNAPYKMKLPIYIKFKNQYIVRKINKMLADGKKFLTYEDYYNYIKKDLPFNKKIIDKFESTLAKELNLIDKKPRVKRRKRKKRKRSIIVKI